MKVKKIIKTLSIIYLPLLGTSQDIHFSQFDESPLFVNPGNTGLFEGTHRVMATYRNQWASIGAPYRTIGATYDAGLFKNKWNHAMLGTGLVIYNDKAGDSELGITQAGLSVSSILDLNSKNKLSLGLQGAFAQRSINQANMQWGSQYGSNGFDSGLPTNEVNAFDSFNYMDVSGGIVWHYSQNDATLSSNDGLSFTSGISMYHLNRPAQKLFSTSTERLHSRINGFFLGNMGLKNSNVSLQASAWYNIQGAASELTVGMLARYRLKEASKQTGFMKESALIFGAYMRIGDAFIPVVRYEISSLKIGISYDLNISKLNLVSHNRGGMEINLGYIFPENNSGTRMVQ